MCLWTHACVNGCAWAVAPSLEMHASCAVAGGVAHPAAAQQLYTRWGRAGCKCQDVSRKEGKGPRGAGACTGFGAAVDGHLTHPGRSTALSWPRNVRKQTKPCQNGDRASDVIKVRFQQQLCGSACGPSAQEGRASWGCPQQGRASPASGVAQAGEIMLIILEGKMHVGVGLAAFGTFPIFRHLGPSLIGTPIAYRLS